MFIGSYIHLMSTTQLDRSRSPTMPCILLVYIYIYRKIAARCTTRLARSRSPIITHTLSVMAALSSQVPLLYTYNTCIYTCIYSRQRIHTYNFMGSRIRDSAAAVHEAAATLGFMLKKEQENVIVAFTQGHDVFLALPTGFGNNLCCCCLPYVFDKRRGFTNASIAVVMSPGGEW